MAVVSNGAAVLGLGDIGPAAAMPVMEGKALLFKERRLRAELDIAVSTMTSTERRSWSLVL